MAEAIAYLYLILDLIIRLLIVVVLITWITLPIYGLMIDNKKKKELERLKDLNDGLYEIYDAPIRKVREFLKENQAEK